MRGITVLEIAWTPERRKLLQLLAEIHPSPGRLYQQAIEYLSRQPLDRPNLMLAAHCLRELPRCLVEVQHLPAPLRADTGRVTKDLHQAWVEAELGFETPSDTKAQPEFHSVTNAVFERAKAVAAAGAAGNGNALRMIALATTGQDTDITAPIRRVQKATAKITSWAHWRYSDELPEIEKVDIELRVIEQALLTRHSNRGDRVVDLRMLISQANRKEGEDVK